jgi:NADH-quinone oxidoreductase subunit M
MTDYLLTLVVFAPLALGAVVALLPASEKAQLRVATLVSMLVSFGLTLWLYLAYDPAGTEFQFEINAPWVPSLGIGYHLGVDGMAVSLMLLTGFLGPIVVLSTWKAIQDRVKEFYLSILILQTAMLGAFCALDLALFYVFWEAMLVPMYLLIGVWGSDNRVYAAIKFFLYTFGASVLMLVAILVIYLKTGAADPRTHSMSGPHAFDYAAFLQAASDATRFSFEARKWLFLAFALAFAVKVPMFPLHTWLPDAHVEAPAAGSIILAGVLLKMGVYGFIRFAVPFFPDAAAYFRPLLLSLAVVGIIYGSLMSFAQKDMKKLVAYSSVAHLGFVMLGVMAVSVEASTGAIYQMLNHGVSTGALFLLIGIVYERTHTRAIADYGGIAKVTPMFAGAFLIILLSSIGLPGTNGFVGEFLVLSGTFAAPFGAHPAIAAPAGTLLPQPSTVAMAALATSGVVLSAIYMLRMYQQVMLGPVRHPENRKLADLSLREWLAVGPMIAMALVMGVFPQPFLARIEPAAQAFARRMGAQPIRAAALHAAVAPASTVPPERRPHLPRDVERHAPADLPWLPPGLHQPIRLPAPVLPQKPLPPAPQE